MAITDKKTGVWGLDQTYNKINQGSIWDYSGINSLFSWGRNNYGVLGLNQPTPTSISSPVQVPGSTWSSSPSNISKQGRDQRTLIKTDGTLWVWGSNQHGVLGINGPSNIMYSSPIQVPGDTWKMVSGGRGHSLAVRTDGTLWTWGYNSFGALGLNNTTTYSSPTQIPGTDWSSCWSLGYSSGAIKTNGELWVWGMNSYGQLGQNSIGIPFAQGISSPVQVPGTTWERVVSDSYAVGATKTDGTLWTWGSNAWGNLGQNDRTQYSSPTQVPGNWSFVDIDANSIGTKTDGTLWVWGENDLGQLGQNNLTLYSSPTQIPGTTWSTLPWNVSAGGNTIGNDGISAAIKTNGTLWTWGKNEHGQLGHNDRTWRSSPVQANGSDYLNTQCVSDDDTILAMRQL